MESRNKRLLIKVISECVSAGFPELEPDIAEARRLVNILRGGTGG